MDADVINRDGEHRREGADEAGRGMKSVLGDTGLMRIRGGAVKGEGT